MPKNHQNRTILGSKIGSYKNIMFLEGYTKCSYKQDPPVSTVYVDVSTGNNNNNGLTEETALKTLGKACSGTFLQDNLIILVKNGTYRNWKFGLEGELNNPAVCSINSKSDVKLTNFPGHVPRIEFDGSGGITLSGVERVFISGFVIEGPNYRITQEEAQAHRLTPVSYTHLTLPTILLV